jgi:uncharacterized lipoprotein NlpE involved in copper resistance
MEKPDAQAFMFHVFEDTISLLDEFGEPVEDEINAIVAESAESEMRAILEGLQKMIAATLKSRENEDPKGSG